MSEKIETKQSKYLELRLQSKEDREQTEIEFQAEESQQQLDQDLLATRKAVAKAKKEYLGLLGAYPLNTQAILDKEVEIEGYEDGIIRLNKLRERLF